MLPQAAIAARSALRTMRCCFCSAPTTEANTEYTVRQKARSRQKFPKLLIANSGREAVGIRQCACSLQPAAHCILLFHFHTLATAGSKQQLAASPPLTACC